MTAEEAFQVVQREFPFRGYMRPGKGHVRIAQVVMQHLQTGARILDYGSGPCDKTSVLQTLGFECTAVDDLQDEWHILDDNRERIMAFAARKGIVFHLAGNTNLPFEKESFDMVMLHDVLEHLHDSPMNLLNDLLELVRPEGYLLVTVPNAVNIRKRLDVLRGRTNLPEYAFFYWYPGPWRGHAREYVRGDLAQLGEFLSLEIVELRGCDHMLERVPNIVRPLYRTVTGVFPSLGDTWLFLGKKRAAWSPKRSITQDELVKISPRWMAYRATIPSGGRDQDKMQDGRVPQRES